MMNPPSKAHDAAATTNQGGAVDVVSVPKMHRLLDQAAHLAGGAGLPPDAFAGIAWQAYLRAFPDVAAQLAESQFEAALEQLRSSGRLAKA